MCVYLSVCLSVCLSWCVCVYVYVCVCMGRVSILNIQSLYLVELAAKAHRSPVRTALHCVVLSRLSLLRVNAATRLELPAETHLSPARHNEQERTISGTYFLDPTPYTSNVTPKH